MTLDLDTLVVDADPARDMAIPSGSSPQARWRYLQLTAGPPGRAHPRRRVVLTVGLGAPVAAALALILVSVIPGPGGSPSAARVSCRHRVSTSTPRPRAATA